MNEGQLILMFKEMRDHFQLYQLSLQETVFSLPAIQTMV